MHWNAAGLRKRRQAAKPSHRRLQMPTGSLDFKKSSRTHSDVSSTTEKFVHRTTMAPTKSVKGKSSKGGKSGGGKSGGVAKKSSKPRPTGSAPEGISKRKQKSMVLAKPGGAQKTKSRLDTSGKRKRRLYSEKELDIPKLNGIVPAGIAKPKGQKKGKVFVDDPVSMMAIMSVVNAEKDKDVESKIMRSRQLEEVREAKRKEAEAKAEEKKAKFVRSS